MYYFLQLIIVYSYMLLVPSPFRHLRLVSYYRSFQTSVDHHPNMWSYNNVLLREETRQRIVLALDEAYQEVPRCKKRNEILDSHIKSIVIN